MAENIEFESRGISISIKASLKDIVLSLVVDNTLNSLLSAIYFYETTETDRRYSAQFKTLQQSDQDRQAYRFPQ